MVWNEVKDDLLCREILLMEPYKFKERSRERGNIWKEISEHLNSASTEVVFFKVDARAVRDRLNLLLARYKQKIKEEEKASGISPELTAVEEALEVILDRIKVCEEELDQVEKEKTDKVAKENEQAADMRKRALETFAETKAANNDMGENTQPNKRRRSSGSDTLEFLREKEESNKNIKQQELELQRSEQQIRINQQNQFFSTMMSQMDQAREQNQQMLNVITQLLSKR